MDAVLNTNFDHFAIKITKTKQFTLFAGKRSLGLGLSVGNWVGDAKIGLAMQSDPRDDMNCRGFCPACTRAGVTLTDE